MEGRRFGGGLSAPGDMKITLAAGAEAARMLADAAFRSQWLALYETCPWATVFQTPSFVDPWFQVYGELHEPLLAVGSRGGETLDGLLLLARSKETGALAHAGAHHAEYQVWIARPEDGDSFMELALDALAARFPSGGLRLVYTPPASPLGWTDAGRRWAGRCERTAIPTPLLSLEDAAAVEALRKKRFRKAGRKMQEIETLGGLELAELAGPEAFEAVFDEVIDFADLRHGAVHDVLPFRRDARKKLLFSAMARVPGLLHVAALRIGPRLAAATVCFRNRGRILLGTITHSPFLAAYSPGSLHIVMLAARLAGERAAAELDLSPGGGYKEMFTTRSEESHILTIAFAAREAARRQRKRRALETVRTAASRMKLERPARVALRFARAPRAALVSRRAWLWSDASASLYALESGRLGELPCVEGFHRDSIAGVLEMRPRGADRRTYLAEALRRFESGGRVYTRAGEDGRGCAIWVTRGESGLSIPGIAAGVPLPPGSAVLCGFAGPAEEYAAAMAAALRGEFRDSTAPTRVFTWAPSADRARRRVLEEAGFVYAGEIRASTRFGRSRLDVPALA